MHIHNIMTPDPEFVDPRTTLREAAQTMERLDIGALPVSDGMRLLGIVTDRDIAIRGVARGLDPDTACVEEVATPDIACCYEDQNVDVAARLMMERQVRRVPVLSRTDEHLVGMVALGDLAQRTKDRKMAGQVLEQISRSGGDMSETRARIRA